MAVSDDYTYDDIQGVWVDNNGQLLVNNEKFQGVTTKKKDIETGEDQK